jgi:hypothetical protein
VPSSSRSCGLFVERGVAAGAAQTGRSSAGGGGRRPQEETPLLQVSDDWVAVPRQLHAQRLNGRPLLQLGYGLRSSLLRTVIATSSAAESGALSMVSGRGGPAPSTGPDKAEEKAIAAAFAMFDTDGSGEISAAELGAVAEELGLGMDANDLASAMAEMDGDGSGEVDLAEFGTAAVT